MKILVTGANGYLGQGCAKKLADAGYNVIATDFKILNKDSRINYKETNLFEVDDPWHYFEKPDVLLHLAWRDGFVHNSINHLLDLPKHYLFLQKLIEAGISQVSVMGSMHEVGFFEGCIKEDTACNPLSLYGVSKEALRKCLLLMTSKTNTIFQWLRGYYIVSNSDYGNSIFSKIVAASKRGESEFPFTSGQNMYDFLDYEEFCNQVSKAVAQNEVNGIIEICSGQPVKLADMVENFINKNNLKIKLKYGAYKDRPYDSKAVWGDNRKIQEILAKK